MTAGPIVLVIEDDPQMRRFLRASLGAHGFEPVEAATAREALGMAASYNPEVILLDLGLPDEDGVALTRRFRERSHVPIVVISARGREQDKVEALDAGADDYLTKPFGVDELLARVRVALRHGLQARGSPELVHEAGPLRVELARRHVTLDGTEIHLTPIEYRLLTYLLQNAGRVLTHRQILRDVWGPGDVGQTHYVRVYVAQLRRKLEKDPARPKLLVTEPGVGYRLRAAT